MAETLIWSMGDQGSSLWSFGSNRFELGFPVLVGWTQSAFPSAKGAWEGQAKSVKPLCLLLCDVWDPAVRFGLSWVLGDDRRISLSLFHLCLFFFFSLSSSYEKLLDVHPSVGQDFFLILTTLLEQGIAFPPSSMCKRFIFPSGY